MIISLEGFQYLISGTEGLVENSSITSDTIKAGLSENNSCLPNKIEGEDKATLTDCFIYNTSKYLNST